MNSSNPVLRPTQTELTPYRSSYKTKCRVIGYDPSYYGPASPLALMLMIRYFFLKAGEISCLLLL